MSLFGYICPFKPDMRMMEYDIYKSYYCGLCKTMGSDYGVISRMTLSYDFAFVAILYSALRDEEQVFKHENCLFNPFKKKLCCKAQEDIEYSSDLAMIMVYYKIKDNIQDELWYKKIFYYMALPLAKSARKKAMKKLPDTDRVLGELMESQYNLEKEGCSSIDRACEPTAKALGIMLSAMSEDPIKQRVLERMGYFLGRYVYMCDALDDIEDDLKEGKYNPFLTEYSKDVIENDDREAIIENCKAQMYMNIAEVIKSYQLLEIKKHGEILDNIIYLGLKSTVNKLEYKRSQPKI